MGTGLSLLWAHYPPDIPETADTSDLDTDSATEYSPRSRNRNRYRVSGNYDKAIRGLKRSKAEDPVGPHDAFDSMPDEVLVAVLYWLDIPQLAIVASVSKRWQRIAIGDEWLWGRHYAEHMANGFMPRHRFARPWVGFNLGGAPRVQTHYRDEMQHLSTLLLDGGARHTSTRCHEFASRHQLSIHSGPLDNVDVSMSGQSLLTAAQDGRILLWDVSSVDDPLIECDIQLRQWAINCVVSPDAHFIAYSTRSRDHAAIIDASAAAKDGYSPLQDILLQGHSGVVRAIKFVDNINVVSCDDNAVRLWDVEQQMSISKIKATPRVTSGLFCLSVSPTENNVYVCGTGMGGVSVFDARAAPYAITSYDIHDTGVWDVQFSPNGQGLCTVASDATASILDFRMMCPTVPLSTSSGLDNNTTKNSHPKLRTFSPPQGVTDSVGLSGGFGYCGFSIDGTVLFCGADDGNIYRWDTITRKQLPKLQTGTEVHGLCVSPDGRFIASTYAAHSAMLWCFTSSLTQTATQPF